MTSKDIYLTFVIMRNSKEKDMLEERKNCTLERQFAIFKEQKSTLQKYAEKRVKQKHLEDLNLKNIKYQCLLASSDKILTWWNANQRSHQFALVKVSIFLQLEINPKNDGKNNKYILPYVILSPSPQKSLLVLIRLNLFATFPKKVLCTKIFFISNVSLYFNTCCYKIIK